MVELSMLVMPILLSAVIVFIVSSVIHMGPFWHRSDYPRIANEAQFLDAVRPLNIPPGDYMFPRAAGGAEMRSPEFLEKIKRGPFGMMTIFPPKPVNMGKTLGFWFIHAIVVSIFAAYVAGRALPPGAHYLAVFRFAGVTAFTGYSLALWQMWIWYGRSTSMTIKATVDGLIYGLLTAGVFGWLWPR